MKGDTQDQRRLQKKMQIDWPLIADERRQQDQRRLQKKMQIDWPLIVEERRQQDYDETPEETINRLDAVRLWLAETRSRETSEETANRLDSHSVRRMTRRLLKTPEQNENRLKAKNLKQREDLRKLQGKLLNTKKLIADRLHLQDFNPLVSFQNTP